MPWRRRGNPDGRRMPSPGSSADPLNMIFGQVVFGDLMTRVLDRFSIMRMPSSVTVSVNPRPFSPRGCGRTGATCWRACRRPTCSPPSYPAPACLFVSLADSRRRAVAWRVAVVNRPAMRVRETLANMVRVRLLIVNSPNECVIGGLEEAVAQAIAQPWDVRPCIWMVWSPFTAMPPPGGRGLPTAARFSDHRQTGA
jgi:hypothetical protein